VPESINPAGLPDSLTGKVWPHGHVNPDDEPENEGEQVLEAEGGLAGVRPAKGAPLANRADAAYAELEALRAEADRLGIKRDPTASLADLRARVEAARER
jgi:hypothetical protein